MHYCRWLGFLAVSISTPICQTAVDSFPGAVSQVRVAALGCNPVGPLPADSTIPPPPSHPRQHPSQPPQIQRRLHRIGQATQIGFAAGWVVDRGACFHSGPGQQGAEGGGVVEEAVAVGGENLPVGRDGALGAAVGEVDGGMGQCGALGDAEVDFVAGHGRPAR